MKTSHRRVYDTLHGVPSSYQLAARGTTLTASLLHLVYSTSGPIRGANASIIFLDIHRKLFPRDWVDASHQMF